MFAYTKIPKERTNSTLRAAGMSVCERSSTNYGQEPNIRCFVASHALIEVAKGDE